jgi:5'-deoxynucleotidase YfbR-like HD superfamily hydrolase
MLTIEQLKHAMNLRNVSRFQTHRLQHRQMVDQHSFRATLIYVFLGGKELMPMLLHDLSETITGDLPSPIKKDLKGLEKFEEIEPKFQDSQEKRLAKVADKLELVLDLREQLNDIGKLPKRLMDIYETELENALDIAKELGKAKEVKQLLKELNQ